MDGHLSFFRGVITYIVEIPASWQVLCARLGVTHLRAEQDIIATLQRLDHLIILAIAVVFSRPAVHDDFLRQRVPKGGVHLSPLHGSVTLGNGKAGDLLDEVAAAQQLRENLSSFFKRHRDEPRRWSYYASFPVMFRCLSHAATDGVDSQHFVPTSSPPANRKQRSAHRALSVQAGAYRGV